MKKLFCFLMMVLSVCCSTVVAQSSKKLVKAGDKFYEAKQYRDAFEEYNRAQKLDPKRYEAYLGMGKSLLMLNRPEEAANEFKRAAAFGASKWEPHYYLGKLYGSRHEWNEALKHLEAAADMERKNDIIQSELFKVYIQKGAFTEALKTSEELLKSDKKNAQFIYLKGVALDSLKQYSEAGKFYNDARFSNPKLVEAYLGSAHTRLQTGEFEKALEDCNKAIERSKTSANAYIMRSKVKLALKDFHGAINDLSAAIDIGDTDFTARRMRAKAYAAAGQFQNAISDWTAVIENNPQDFHAYHQRAAAYEAVGDFKHAARDYADLLRISPYDQQAEKLLKEARQRVFEINRENKLPELFLLSHRVNESGYIEVPDNVAVLALHGEIHDDSPIQSFTLNGQKISVDTDSLNPYFEYQLPLIDENELRFEVVDVYDNAANILYRIRRTEISPPQVQLLAPYADDSHVVKVDRAANVIRVEGKIRDESNITAITINGVNASYIPDQLNPRFTAEVQIVNQSHLTVSAIDQFGNSTDLKYEISRGGTSLLASNPMGRTWVVFVENSSYHSFASIDGPAKDVEMMKQALDHYHIDNFIHKKDLSKTEMERFFSIDLRDLIKSNQVNSLLVWYAGHGKFINETGYWIPVDASRDDEFSYFNINALKAGLLTYSADLTHTLVVSDACESGPSFADVMREDPPQRKCDDWEAVQMKSSQVFSSAGYELASDHSQFTHTFANMLGNNPNTCLPIESVVAKVTEVVQKQGRQSPKFGVIAGMGDENGTFFFIKKNSN